LLLGEEDEILVVSDSNPIISGYNYLKDEAEVDTFSTANL
jgi:hypothetical protein